MTALIPPTEPFQCPGCGHPGGRIKAFRFDSNSQHMTISHSGSAPDCELVDCELGDEESIALQATWASAADLCPGHEFVVKCRHCGTSKT